MTQIVSSISSLPIYAPSAAYAPTNGADVSAIASAYQVVFATAGDGSYVTSINGLGLSGQGGAQVVTSTASAYYYSAGTKTGISAINGSAIIAMSAVGASNAGTALYADTAYTAYYDANGRALTSIGTATGGGSVTSPSGTIVVMNGNEIEGTNSAAVVAQTSMGVTSVLPLQAYSIGPNDMTSLTYGNLSDSGMNLVFMIAGTYYGDDATVIISGRDYNWNLASASGLIVNGDTSANIPLGTVQSQLSASSDYWINLMNGQDLSGVKDPGYAVTGVRELAWQSAVDNVTNTVSSNSASWGGGGEAFPVEYNSGSCSASLETGYFVSTSRPSLTLSSTGVAIYPRFIVRNGTGTASKGSYYLSDAFEFTTGSAGSSGTKVLRIDPQQVSSKNFLLYGPSGSTTYGRLTLNGSNSSAYICIGSTNAEHTNYIRPSSISSWWNVYDHVNSASASWGGGGIVTATAGDGTSISSINEMPLLDTSVSSVASAIASSYSESAVSSKQDSSGMTAYVEKTAYDDLYSAFTAVSSMLNTYSSYFSSISAKVDSTAIGVEE